MAKQEGLQIPPGPWAIRDNGRGGFAMVLSEIRSLEIYLNGGAFVILPNGERLNIPKQITNVAIYKVDILAGLG